MRQQRFVKIRRKIRIAGLISTNLRSIVLRVGRRLNDETEGTMEDTLVSCTQAGAPFGLDGRATANLARSIGIKLKVHPSNHRARALSPADIRAIRLAIEEGRKATSGLGPAA
jgi:hypothetical protein